MHRKKHIAALKVSMRALPQEEQDQAGASRGRGRGRGHGAVRVAARTPTEDDPPREDPQVRARIKRSAAIVLPEAQNGDLVEWIQANECLYNKGHPKYKNSGHKFQLWSVKATELGITEKALMTWWQNQRTKYGRLTRSMGASGSGRKDDSGDDKWCRRSFQFLGRFIGRTHPMRGVDVDPDHVDMVVAPMSNRWLRPVVPPAAAGRDSSGGHGCRLQCSRFTIVSGQVLVTPNIAVKKPMYVWPLANSSLYYDVVGGNDIPRDANKECFYFTDGPPDLPYSVFNIKDESNSFLDIVLEGKSPIMDLTISMYVYPSLDGDEISGTLLHYQSEDREIMQIRTLRNTFLVSFRDEYGMSAGMMYLINFLEPKTWNYVAVTRDYKTGRISVYLNGEEMYNEDDEFSDIISFPHSGRLRVGKSQDPDDEDLFTGNFACVQMYNTVVGMAKFQQMKDFCQPNKWNRAPNVYYEERNGQFCLTDPPTTYPPITEDVGDVVTMTTLTRQSLWLSFLAKFKLSDSAKTNGYSRRMIVDKAPPTSINSITNNNFNVTDGHVCSRLCVRVQGCRAFMVATSNYGDSVKECAIYDAAETEFVDKPGAKYYTIKT